MMMTLLHDKETIMQYYGEDERREATKEAERKTVEKVLKAGI